MHSGFLHPEGVYDDPKGGDLRSTLYKYLKAHFQFANELNLFVDVDHHAKFSANVYQKPSSDDVEIEFLHTANLYSPSTVDDCFEFTESTLIPGIKNDEGTWETSGHPARLIRVDQEALTLFANLYDDEEACPTEARLPALHTQSLVNALRKFSIHPRRLSSFGGNEVCTTQHWNETNSQKDGTIRRDTQFAEKAEELILSGPHFFVANPLNKTPRYPCKLNSDYDVLDLTVLPDDYLPRTNYVPDCDPAEYQRRTPKVPWGTQPPVTNFYRVVNREMIGPSAERTFIPMLAPKGVGHINTCIATTFHQTILIIDFLAMG
jgi:hypothetical protein